MQTWHYAKSAVESGGGIVVSQHRGAAAVGARILAAGGNAVDAAVATGFAVGVLEPWMSGIGGGGYMLVAPADGAPVQCVDFGMVAPAALDPADYPMIGGVAPGSFDWPAVAEDRNLKGPLSVAVPGHVAGMRAASERFGRLAWKDLLAPAIEIATAGLPIDWFAAFGIAVAARELAEFPETRRIYLPDGLPPMPNSAEGPLPRLGLGRLATTLTQIAEAGARDFYEGEIAAAIAAEMRRRGGKLAAADLAGYRARIAPAARRLLPRRGGRRTTGLECRPDPAPDPGDARDRDAARRGGAGSGRLRGLRESPRSRLCGAVRDHGRPGRARGERQLHDARLGRRS